MTDPRFDPAFQRGYSGPEPELVAREQTPVASVPSVADPVAVPEEIERPARPEPDAAVEPERRFSIHNPSRFALLLLGIVLLLAAVGSLYAEVLHPQTTSTTVESQFVELLISALPPVLGLAGFASVILWLALGALDHVTLDTGGND